MIEQTYYFTFRNPKYGGSSSVSAASVQSIPVMATRRDTRSLDHEAGMADLGLDEEDAVVSAPVRSAPRRTPSLNCGMMPAVFLPSNCQFQ